MSIEQMREALKKAYIGPAWNGRVDRMSDNQVAAMYLRLLHANKLPK